MKRYEKPVVEVIPLSQEDVVCTSPREDEVPIDPVDTNTSF